MLQPRSYLFVPGDRPDRFAKAVASGAHRIIIDLEDAVGPARKDEARRYAVQWLAAGRAGVLRINGVDTPWFEDDIAAAAMCPGTEIMVPKAEAQALECVARALPGLPLIALVESVAGVAGLGSLVWTPGVTRLAFGNLDFSSEARMSGSTLDLVRFQIALHSRHANLPPPIDGVTVALDDEAELTLDIRQARALGFRAKLCIHPRQVGPANAGFAPSQEEAEWARRVMAACENADGVVQVDGEMVDKPVLDRAVAIVSEKEASMP